MGHSFDAIIIGAGQAGPSLAGRLTAAGMSVLIVERKLFGGTCVNTGCMPTKTMVASAYAAHLARRGADYGVVIEQPVRVDMKRVRQRADTVSFNARTGVETWLRGMRNCTVAEGHARFAGAHTIAVDGVLFQAPRIFINVGGRANIPDMPGIRDVDYLTNTTMMQLDTLPRHLVVIGGSYIGLEFAQMYRRFGAQVTVVEKGARLVGREDADVSEAIRTILENEGIACRLDANCIAFKRHADGTEVHLDCDSGARNVAGSHVLLAIGRRPNTDDLGLDKAGIETDERGYIKVDDFLATTAEGVWALGDCNGQGAFTHTAYNDYEIVAANLLDGESRKISDRVPAYALYIDPPLGRAGMSEAQARATGRPILVSKRPMSRVGRAVEKDETQGFMKIVADAQTQQILGAAILGTSGDEAIHGIIDAMSARVGYPALKWAVPVHPTVSELIPTVLGDLAAPVPT
ncbi:FAD-containing oxidoreductase [Phyllobacterium myrsinacearum]|uniref:FAD-containing oxidoreductase n=1 Tax=Phyllobacterium myrsinacearum TaxID=28101 RepID=A0A2S9JQ30_9HYPH|nr:FAD-containing oxidoreductase [Phyllobacterium myrsinacearum]PRD55269.1 FAD-containing oxidoreductase [Phyllobacterium myrsinacearum]PWV89273.1 pyruvate/2-oxoglutarate dehydrogenase complex dihydrolipoamide dehydrogenase (E3) component [Phyllobacterium myrsinacearum]RZV05664.1 pyruvate/2-oxoglutarate dehydrogenase complex dihydrolipoamide dehydrogenase (E3) component [Phyllobacterium myrsinacearum]